MSEGGLSIREQLLEAKNIKAVEVFLLTAFSSKGVYRSPITCTWKEWLFGNLRISKESKKRSLGGKSHRNIARPIL